MRTVTLESTRLATPNGCRMIFGRGVVVDTGSHKVTIVGPEHKFPNYSLDLKVQEVVIKKLSQNSIPNGRILRVVSNGLFLVSWSFGKQLRGDGKSCHINVSPFQSWR